MQCREIHSTPFDGAAVLYDTYVERSVPQNADVALRTSLSIPDAGSIYVVSRSAYRTGRLALSTCLQVCECRR
jgi:hypothetical protein